MTFSSLLIKNVLSAQTERLTVGTMTRPREIRSRDTLHNPSSSPLPPTPPPPPASPPPPPPPHYPLQLIGGRLTLVPLRGQYYRLCVTGRAPLPRSRRAVDRPHARRKGRLLTARAGRAGLSWQCCWITRLALALTAALASVLADDCLSRSLAVSVSVSLCLWLSRSLSWCLAVSVRLSLCVSGCLGLSVSLAVSWCLAVSVRLSLWLSRSVSLCLWLSRSVCVCVSLSVWLFLWPSLSQCVCVCLGLSAWRRDL